MVLDRFSEKVAYKITVWEGNLMQKRGYTGSSVSTDIKSLDDYYRKLCFTRSKILVNEWEQESNMSVPYGKLLGVDKLTKGNLAVYHLNESGHPYSDCHQVASFFAEDKKSLERLCEDWGFDRSKIVGDTEVVQYF